MPLFLAARLWRAQWVAALTAFTLVGAGASLAAKEVPADVLRVGLGGLVCVGILAVWVAHLTHAAREAIVNAARERDGFVAAAAHDLKNPLTAICGQVVLLHRHNERFATPQTSLSPAAGDGDAAGLAARLRRGLDSIDGSAARALALLNALLDTVQVRAGEPLELEVRPTDLVVRVQRVAAAQQAATDVHRIEVRAAAAEMVGTWDAFRIERVLENLLSNAVKYSPGGGVIAVGIGQEPAGARDSVEWAVVTVRDQGVGIPAADLRRVFLPFQRAGNAAATAPGTGIGLAGARRIVEMHGGTLEASSVEGRGSAFTLRLPLELQRATTPLSAGTGVLAGPTVAEPTGAASISSSVEAHRLL